MTATAHGEGSGADGSTMMRTALIMSAPMPTATDTIWIGRRAAFAEEAKGLGGVLMAPEHRRRTTTDDPRI
ncbi:hypothetical protein GCM10027039_03030 [Terrabacter koreensis]